MSSFNGATQGNGPSKTARPAASGANAHDRVENLAGSQNPVASLGVPVEQAGQTAIFFGEEMPDALPPARLRAGKMPVG